MPGLQSRPTGNAWPSLGDPSAGTPSYGAHHSKEQVAELIALSLDTLELDARRRLAHGLRRARVTSQRNVGGVIPTILARRDECQFSTIAPTTHFASMGTLQQTPPTRFDGTAASLGEGASGEPKDVSRRDVRVTPMFLRVLYGTVKYEPAATGRNVLGVTGYLGQYPSPSDPVMGSIPPLKLNRSTAVGITRTTPVTRRTLNIQVTQGMTYPVQHVFYSSAGPPPFNSDGSWSTNSNEPYLDWIIYITSKGPIPLTIITSYGDDEQTVPEDYAKSVCTLFARFGQRGVSVFLQAATVVSAEVITWPTTTRAKTASSPSFPYPVRVEFYLSQAAYYKHSPWGRGILDISAQSTNYQIVLRRTRLPQSLAVRWRPGLDDITAYGSNPGCKTDGFSAMLHTNKIKNKMADSSVAKWSRLPNESRPVLDYISALLPFFRVLDAVQSAAQSGTGFPT
ncbi:subtilisin-like protein [Lactarius pseudohatsudake]|nr:subtilisin-like protein [Lactarius pseudohatsudake]